MLLSNVELAASVNLLKEDRRRRRGQKNQHKFRQQRKLGFRFVESSPEEVWVEKEALQFVLYQRNLCALQRGLCALVRSFQNDLNICVACIIIRYAGMAHPKVAYLCKNAYAAAVKVHDKAHVRDRVPYNDMLEAAI